MFVSSYNTYVNANVSDKIKEKSEEYKKGSASFSEKLLSQPVKTITTSSAFPINYVSEYKALNNRQRLQENTQNDANNKKVEFSKVKAITGAKVAYADNSKIFSLLLKPATTIDLTPKIDRNMPQEAQKAKELIMRHTMVNTYLANDNYYKITA
jgi:hypothetical protein